MTGRTMEIIKYLHGADLDAVWELKEKKEKRSLNQNSYYWVLLGKLADKLRQSKTVIHNQMLRDYGQKAIVNDKPVWVILPDTEEAETNALNAETYHLKPTSQVKFGKGGMYRTYILLRGSHEYNSGEMSILLDGLIQEAQQQGIETLTPLEVEQMKQYARENEKNSDKQEG